MGEASLVNIMYSRFSLIVILTVLVACGGGASNSSTPTVIDPPTSQSIPTETTGVITGFGSVFINGVEYETDAASVSIDDDDNASETDLQLGMVVTLNGEINDDGKTGKANSIHYDEQLKGPLSSIDLAANTLIILEQTVVFDELTSLDNVVIAELVPGDFLEISGFFNLDGQLYATRIEKEDGESQVKVQGEIALLDTSSETFMLGELLIDYSVAEFVNFNKDDLADGQMVRVKGDVSAIVENVFQINQIKQKVEDEQHEDGDRRHLEGIITVFDSSTSFVVNGIHVITDENTEFEYGSPDSLALNVRVKLKGHYNNEGDLLAEEIRIHQRTNLKIEGQVQAIDVDASTITVLDVVFEVNEHTKMKDDSDSHDRFFNLADLSVGDTVEVKGFIDSNGHNIATKLTRDNEDAGGEIELKGTVSAIENFSFIVVEVWVQTDINTDFEGLHGDHLSQQAFFEQLQDGMLVEVKGHIVESHFIALKVEIKKNDVEGDDDEDHWTEFRGIVDEVAVDSLIVSDHMVVTTAQTQYEINDDEVSAEQFWQIIKIGDQVKVKGDVNDEGVITARAIELEEDDD